jgi:hypothetical protein
MHSRSGLELGDQIARKLHREHLGLALGEVDQNICDLIRLGRQIDTGNDVCLVFILGEPRRLGIAGVFRESVDLGALRFAFLLWKIVGVN